MLVPSLPFWGMKRCDRRCVHDGPRRTAGNRAPGGPATTRHPGAPHARDAPLRSHPAPDARGSGDDAARRDHRRRVRCDPVRESRPGEDLRRRPPRRDHRQGRQHLLSSGIQRPADTETPRGDEELAAREREPPQGRKRPPCASPLGCDPRARRQADRCDHDVRGPDRGQAGGNRAEPPAATGP